jgi:hypothetical protein
LVDGAGRLEGIDNPQSYLPGCCSLLELSGSSDDPGAAGTDIVAFGWAGC